MNTINEYKVEIFKKVGKEPIFEKRAHAVGLENERFIVLTDAYFTKLNKKKKDAYSGSGTIEEIFIHERKWDFATEYNGIVYHLFTHKTKKPAQIRKEIQTFIEKEWGYLRGINLDFIK